MKEDPAKTLKTRIHFCTSCGMFRKTEESPDAPTTKKRCPECGGAVRMLDPEETDTSRTSRGGASNSSLEFFPLKTAVDKFVLRGKPCVSVLGLFPSDTFSQPVLDVVVPPKVYFGKDVFPPKPTKTARRAFL